MIQKLHHNAGTRKSPLLSGIIIQLRLSLFCSLILVTGSSFNSKSYGDTPAAIEDPTGSLLALPYLQYVKEERAPDKIGTTIYKKHKVFPGYNIYASNNAGNDFADLIDMDGTIIHRWKKNIPDNVFQWHQLTPFPDGSIFLTSNLTAEDWQLVDANSHPLATYDMPEQQSHHATYCLKAGGFLGLVANKLQIQRPDLLLSVTDNSLVHVSPEGRLLKIIPLSKLFANDPSYQKRLEACATKLKEYLAKPSPNKAPKPGFDLFHANNIENLEWDIPGIAKKGDWLVTVPRFDRILIVDPEQEQIIWQWGENIISFPHHATFLNDKQILLFDNGNNKKSSRVIILDIKSKKIVWQYGQKPGQEFFTALRGSAQRLPNGNTLIAESDKGRVFEVTISGEIVWEWYTDVFTEGRYKGKRKAIYRMSRLPYNFFKNVTLNYGKL